MTTSIRTICLLLILALLLPSAAFPVFAEETSTDTSAAPAAGAAVGSTEQGGSTGTTNAGSETAPTGTQTSSDSATASQTSQSTQNAVDDTSQSQTAAGSSTESDTTVHASATGGGGTASSTTETTNTTTETGSGSSTPSGPSLTDDASTTTQLDTVATSSAATPGTTTETSAGPEASTSSTSTPVTITTGDATAGANVVNAVNSNFVNSSGEMILSNYFDPIGNGIDLRSSTSTFATGVLCMLFSCTGSQGVTLNLNGTSSLENALFLNATSGGNTITTNGGDASILTGNAYTGLNLINLANLNVVDSNYFIAALNIFRGISGDIVFPGLSGFFNTLLSGTVPADISLDSLANVVNQINFQNQTGGNGTDATSSAITTGSTRSLGTLLNQLNSNDIGGANLAVLLRVQGNWTGEIFGAPEGLTVVRGDDGSIYLMSKGIASALALGDSSLTASSSALIWNHADLGAFTGNNGIFGADSARIITGNAFTGANVLNLANQNILGKNWLTAVINIFGDFTGNIAFGRPDLWVGERVEAPAVVTDGSDVVFHFSIANKGDAPATAATFTATMDTSHLEFTDAPTFTSDLGTLQPGQSTEVVYRARVHAAPGTDIATGGAATLHETDNNSADNRDSVTLHTLSSGGGGGSGHSLISASVGSASSQSEAVAALQITRQTKDAVIGGGTRTVHEELSVSNLNDATSSPVDLHDLLKDPSGTVIQDEGWPLGTLAPHEEVHVTYDVLFDADAPVGRYTLSSVLASDITGDIESKDNGTITIVGIPAPQVAGASTRSFSVSQPTITRMPIAVASSSTSSASSLDTSLLNPLLAAVVNARIPWTYALSFVMAFAVLAGFLYSILWLRRRHF